jgi:hypothetical protein
LSRSSKDSFHLYPQFQKSARTTLHYTGSLKDLTLPGGGWAGHITPAAAHAAILLSRTGPTLVGPARRGCAAEHCGGRAGQVGRRAGTGGIGRDGTVGRGRGVEGRREPGVGRKGDSAALLIRTGKVQSVWRERNSFLIMKFCQRRPADATLQHGRKFQKRPNIAVKNKLIPIILSLQSEGTGTFRPTDPTDLRNHTPIQCLTKISEMSKSRENEETPKKEIYLGRKFNQHCISGVYTRSVTILLAAINVHLFIYFIISEPLPKRMYCMFVVTSYFHLFPISFIIHGKSKETTCLTSYYHPPPPRTFSYNIINSDPRPSKTVALYVCIDCKIIFSLVTWNITVGNVVEVKSHH